jgi:enolase-phosphatase E1
VKAHTTPSVRRFAPLRPHRVVLLELESVVLAPTLIRSELQPVVRRELPAFLRRHGESPSVRALVGAIRLSLPRPTLSDEALRLALDQWILEERGHSAFRQLVAKVWDDIAERGRLRTTVATDAAAYLLRSNAIGRAPLVFGSWPAHAQSLLLSHSDSGPLQRAVHRFVEVPSSDRRAPASYARIVESLGASPDDVTVVSGSARDLEAASLAGLATLQVLRGDARSDGDFFWARNLDALEPSRAAS